ncbi:MAG: hypothetical protein ACRDTT_25145 [Pseudonocardiaceae bacterium]
MAKSASRGGSTAGVVARGLMWLRHWRIMLTLAAGRALWLFVSGQVLLSSRRTDATWWHRARKVRGGWWASLAGWARCATRWSPLLLFVGWRIDPVWTVAVTVLLVVVVVRVTVARVRQAVNDARWLLPMWPAIVRILGSSVADAPPRSWVEMPADPRAPDAEIVVGLPDDSGDDRPKVADLRKLFEQRLEVGRWIADVDHVGRLVTFRQLPPDPELWAPVASILGLDPDDRPAQWLDLPDDPADKAAEVRIYLPDHLADDAGAIERLRLLADQRLPGSWAAKPDSPNRVVVLRHKPPEPKPPALVDVSEFLPSDWLAELVDSPEMTVDDLPEDEIAEGNGHVHN